MLGLEGNNQETSVGWLDGHNEDIPTMLNHMDKIEKDRPLCRRFAEGWLQSPIFPCRAMGPEHLLVL